MEDNNDDFDNLFEEYEGNEEQSKESGEKEASGETSESLKVPAPKRVVKNPRLKFNADRLCGDRGIPVLVDYFKDVKFRGKGFEKQDLCKLLARLEHWTHRLFPSMKFEDSLRQIEKLGKKRAVQTCLRKIRLDMPILSSDFIHDDEEDKDEVQRIDDDDASTPIDPFDKLIEDTREMPSSPVNISAEPSTPAAEKPSGHILGSSLGSSLTDEQRKRMDYNRMLAAERRRAKLMSSQTLSNIIHDDEVRTQSVPYDTLNKHSSSNALNLEESGNSNNVERHDSFQSDARVSSEAPTSIANDEFMEEVNGHENLAMSKNSPIENHERLRLDDMIDLIERGEPCQERSELKHACNSSEVTTSIVDDELSEEMNRDKNITVPKVSVNENSERLKLDDLMDLIEDDKSCST